MSESKLYIKDIQREFSKRLNQLLCERGFTSRTPGIGSSKVLSEIIQCSIPMARRYLLGNAIPGKKRLEKITLWANVSLDWLMRGLDVPREDFDENLLKAILSELFDQVSNSENHVPKNEYIDLALETYKKISKLSARTKEKIDFAKLMIQSLTPTKERKIESIAIGF